MRAAFARTLAELAGTDSRVLLLTGDLGYMALEPFSDQFPDRFINVGVAEQNLIGVATGLAESGFLPFVYSIATFASLRGYEFLRNGPVAHRLPVRVVGVGGGFEYGAAGRTHHGLEDVGVMRLQPGLTVVAPADHEQTVSALEQTWELDGPIYYRIGKDDRTLVPGLDGRFRLGRPELVRPGRDALIVTMGAIAATAVEAATQLASRGVDAGVLVISTMSPVSTAELASHLEGFDRVVSVEAHVRDGGVGSLVAETIAEHGLPCRLSRRGATAPDDGRSGSQAYYYARHGLTSGDVADAVERLK